MNLVKKIRSRLKLYGKVINTVKRNKFSYSEIQKKSRVLLLNNNDCTVNVIIGFRGRTEFHEPIIDSFNNAFRYYQRNFADRKHTFCLTFVEHSAQPVSENTLQGRVNYIWTPGNVTEQYSRSFSYNFGVKYSNKAKYYLLHDIDILVKENFFEQLFVNLSDRKCMQPYGKRRVLYLSKELTDRVIKKEIDYNVFSEKTPEVSLPGILGSKGGSIFVERDLYFEVGGFDPEVFWGYAAEDQFFWEKLLTVYGKVSFADSPPIDMFHMWHPLTNVSNPQLGEMEHYFNDFKAMTKANRLKFIQLQSQSLNK